MKHTLHLLVKGQVQRVGYRKFVSSKARDLGINGNVKNLKNGEVEIFATAELETLQAFIELLKIGPIQARIDSIYTESIPKQDFSSFVILGDI